MRVFVSDGTTSTRTLLFAFEIFISLSAIDLPDFAVRKLLISVGSSVSGFSARTSTRPKLLTISMLAPFVKFKSRLKFCASAKTAEKSTATRIKLIFAKGFLIFLRFARRDSARLNQALLNSLLPFRFRLLVVLELSEQILHRFAACLPGFQVEQGDDNR